MPSRCNDGLDNDGGGLLDHPADPGCANLSDLNESPDPQRADGIDNDADGDTDLTDTGCADANDPIEGSNAACSDGFDNDEDAATDFPADPECTSEYDNDEEACCIEVRGSLDELRWQPFMNDEIELASRTL